MAFMRSASVLRQAGGQIVSIRPLYLRSPAATHLLHSLAVLEQRDGKLENASLSAVTAAQRLGGSVTGIIAGSSIKPVAEAAAKVKGLDRVVFIENESYDKVSS